MTVTTGCGVPSHVLTSDALAAAFRRGVSTGEVQLGQSQYQRALGWPSTQANSGVVTYTFNWQPTHVTWYMDGKPIKKMTNGDATTYNGGSRSSVYQAPALPMKPSFTIWTDTRATGPFGGHIDVTKGPYVAAFNNLRQVVCDASVPAAATVPDWLA
jgi:beta-glucanase (GH16 family)